MKELFKIQIKNKASKLLLAISILLSFPLYSQNTLTDESGYFQVYGDEYNNNMNVYWDINVGSNKYLKLIYWVRLSETTNDYINIYEVDENGNQYLIGTYYAIDYGEIRTSIPSGRARVEFITDHFDSYADGNYSLTGFDMSYYTDNTVYASNDLEVKYNTLIWGNMEIGTRIPNANSQLLIKGKIKARNVEMTTNGWADYVFDKDYKLPALTEVNQYIAIHKHLPDIPSAVEVKEKGVNIADMQVKLLQKIEELTLYVIQHQKDIDGLRKDYNQ